MKYNFTILSSISVEKRDVFWPINIWASVQIWNLCVAILVVVLVNCTSNMSNIFDHFILLLIYDNPQNLYKYLIALRDGKVEDQTIQWCQILVAESEWILSPVTPCWGSAALCEPPWTEEYIK